MRRRVSANVCAALVMAALLSGCGGGHRAETSTSKTRSTATSATTRTVAPSPAGGYWTYAKVIGSLAGRTLALPRGSVRLDGALLECNGEGTPMKTGTTPSWSHYTCTQTLFQNGADRDITFEVTVVSPTQLSITSPRYGAQ